MKSSTDLEAALEDCGNKDGANTTAPKIYQNEKRLPRHEQIAMTPSILTRKSRFGTKLIRPRPGTRFNVGLLFPSVEAGGCQCVDAVWESFCCCARLFRLRNFRKERRNARTARPCVHRLQAITVAVYSSYVPLKSSIFP